MLTDIVIKDTWIGCTMRNITKHAVVHHTFMNSYMNKIVFLNFFVFISESLAHFTSTKYSLGEILIKQQTQLTNKGIITHWYDAMSS